MVEVLSEYFSDDMNGLYLNEDLHRDTFLD